MTRRMHLLFMLLALALVASPLTGCQKARALDPDRETETETERLEDDEIETEREIETEGSLNKSPARLDEVEVEEDDEVEEGDD